MIRSLTLLFAALLPVCRAGAVLPETWRQSDFADFEKATLNNVALRSDGRLSLAPVLTELLDSSTPYLWALAEDSKGNVYAGGGGPGTPGARVFVISPDGKSRVLAEFDALEVHALAVDRNDRLYAATSPDARVYRIAADGKSELFYDPAAKYVWAMAFDAKGNLYVATGDQGLVHRVTPEGKGAVFYRTEANHARALAVDGQGNLIVGTEPDGLVVRVSPSGQGFVLFETPKREVTAVAVAPNGMIYAAGVGTKMPATAPAA
jgi:sugar lactone lactonase YvrE